MGTREGVRAQARILQHRMCDADAVDTALRGDTGSDPGVAERLRTEGKLIGLPVGGDYRYPAFQFDVETGAVRGLVAEVNALLGAPQDPWGVASWWLTDNGRLPEGTTPADLVAHTAPAESRRVLVLAAALIAD